jgi:hypothetical protein
MRLINFVDPIDQWVATCLLSKKQMVYNADSEEYWLNLHVSTNQEINFLIEEKKANKIVFYDILHAESCMQDWWVPLIKKTSQKIPVEWITVNKLPIDDLSITHYDFYWNRCKSMHTNGPMGVRYKSHGVTCKHHELNWNPRSHQYLAPVRSNTFWREDLLMFLKKYQGFYSNVKLYPSKHPDIEQAYLETDFFEDQFDLEQFRIQYQITEGALSSKLGVVSAIPVAKHYYDNSYISCQVESQHLTGGGIVFSEKTYDHLIQGRLVLNFGPQFYYQTLEQQGWKLWKGIDLSWDSISDDNIRWNKYLECLKNLFDFSMSDLHDIFLLNKSNIEHNWQQLYNRPYDYID